MHTLTPAEREQMNRIWDLSEPSMPRIYAEQRENEWRRTRLKIRNTFCYQFCRAFRKRAFH